MPPAQTQASRMNAAQANEAGKTVRYNTCLLFSAEIELLVFSGRGC